MLYDRVDMKGTGYPDPLLYDKGVQTGVFANML